MSLLDHRCKVGVLHDNFLYFSNWSNSALFKLNLDSMVPEFIGFFDDEPTNTWLHRGAFCYKSIVGFTPDRGQYLYMLDIESKKEKKISLNKHINNGPFIEDCHIYKDKLWMIPCLAGDMQKQDSFYSYSFIDGTICEHKVFSNYINEKLGYTKGTYIWGTVLAENELICAIAKTETILTINLDDMTIKSDKIGFNDIRGIFISKNGFWLTQHSGTQIGLWRT